MLASMCASPGRRWLLLVAACAALQQALAKGSSEDDDEDDHKALFPLNVYDVTGAICAAIAAFLAAGGGLGGGGIFVPVYVVLVGFPTKAAIPLSNVTILGAAIMNTILNVQKRHPLADRPMIDWDLMLMMQPSTIVGAILGAYINMLLPGVILVIMLVVVCAYTTYRTMKKGLTIYRKETAQIAAMASSSNGHSAESKVQEMVSPSDFAVTGAVQPQSATYSVVPESDPSQDEEQPTSGDEVQKAALQDRAKELLQEDAHMDWRKPVLLVLMVGGASLLTGMAEAYFKCGSGGYWGLNLTVIPLLFVAVYMISRHLIDRHQEKLRVSFPFTSTDVKWDARNTMNCAILCVGAGMLAGMFGVGGGMIQGPLMLEMGVHPQSVVATSATLILYTSATATISFWRLGALVEDYAIMFFIVGFVATCGGQLSAQKITDITGRQSVLVFVIAMVIVLATCLMTYVGISELVADPSSVADTQGLCG